jgi:glycosyltransferase involved in cell wall biosynthesis
MNKIAIVVQRYGEEINGGAEVHARMLAGHLKVRYEVDVLTSRSLNFPVWDNYYPAGEEVIDGIRVLRFTHEGGDPETPRRLGRYLCGNRKYYNTRYTPDNAVSLSLRRIRYRRRKDHDLIFERWIKSDGPVCREMIAYMKREKDGYKAFIFFNYPFYPTCFGLQEAAGKSILVPLAHDEPMLYLSGFGKVFTLPGFIMYNTESEKRLVETAHPGARSVKSDIAGVGFDRPVRGENRIPPVDFPYFTYIGRIDAGKGCPELIDYFSRMNKSHHRNIKLVMIGRNCLKTSVKGDNIIFTGFIGEEEKLSLLQHCEALIISSRYESLSLVTLEAMLAGKPVLASGHCEVLKNHIEQSGAGFVYYDAKDFAGQVDKILSLSPEEKQGIAQNGRSYVERNYCWESIMKKFDAAIDCVGTAAQEAPSGTGE